MKNSTKDLTFTQRLDYLIKKYEFYECVSSNLSLIHLQQLHDTLDETLKLLSSLIPFEKDIKLWHDIFMWKDRIEVLIEDIFESKGIDFYEKVSDKNEKGLNFNPFKEIKF